jgi:hypothetical protein
MRTSGIARRTSVLAVGLLAIGWLVAGVASSASAASTTIDGVTYSVDDAHPELGATVAGYAAGPAVIDIPSSVTIGASSFPVTAIGDFVFSHTAITTVTIPSSVTFIGEQAFEADSSLSTVNFSTGLTGIGLSAFENDGSLTSVDLPNSVTLVSNEAFNADNLTHLTLSTGLTEITQHAFANNNSLQSVTIPSSVTVIDFAAFAADDLRNVVIGSGVTEITNSAFAFNNNLQTVLVPPSVTDIDADAFQNNSTGSLTATFEGAAPTTFGTGVFDVSNPLVVYDVAFGDPPVAGGFTSPTWMGYPTSAVAKISFDTNGHGTAPTPVSAPTGHVLPNGLRPAPPTASGLVFGGWFTAASGGTRWDFDTSLITTDVTLFAHWSATSDPAALPSTGVDATPALLIGSIALLVGLALLIIGLVRRARARSKDAAASTEN